MGWRARSQRGKPSDPYYGTHDGSGPPPPPTSYRHTGPVTSLTSRRLKYSPHFYTAPTRPSTSTLPLSGPVPTPSPSPYSPYSTTLPLRTVTIHVSRPFSEQDSSRGLGQGFSVRGWHEMFVCLSSPLSSFSLTSPGTDRVCPLSVELNLRVKV